MALNYQIKHPKNIQQINSALNVVRECFYNINRAYFVKRILGDTCYRKKYTYLLTKNNSIISHTQLFKKNIYYQGKQLRVIGLGFICTIPKYRNQGYSTKLLKRIIRDISRERASLIILFTRIPKFYERLGFSKVLRKYYLVERRNKPVLKNQRIGIRKFDFDKDVLSLIEIYENFFIRHFGAVVRDFKDWQSQLSYFNEDKKLFLVLEDKNEIKAYIRCKRSKLNTRNIIDIIEFASKGSYGYSLIHFMQYLFKFADTDYIRINSKLVDMDLSVFFKVKEENNTVLMYKFLNKIKGITGSNMKDMVYSESDAF